MPLEVDLMLDNAQPGDELYLVPGAERRLMGEPDRPLVAAVLRSQAAIDPRLRAGQWLAIGWVNEGYTDPLERIRLRVEREARLLHSVSASYRSRFDARSCSRVGLWPEAGARALRAAFSRV